MIQFTDSPDFPNLYRHLASVYRIQTVHDAFYPNIEKEEATGKWKSEYLSQSVRTILIQVLETTDSIKIISPETLKTIKETFAEAAQKLAKLPTEISNFYSHEIFKIETAISSLPEESSKEILAKLSSIRTIFRSIERTLPPLLGRIREEDPEKEKAKSSVASLTKLWNKMARKDFSSREEAISEIQTELQTFPLAIQELYKTDLEINTSTVDTINAYATRYFKELDSVRFSAIQGASHGKVGHPKIITYSVTKSNGSKETHTTFLKNLSSSLEMESHFLYQEICKSLSHLFSVPKGILLDLERNQFTDSAGVNHPIPTDKSERLKTILRYLLTTHTSRLDDLSKELEFQKKIKKEPIAFFERINDPDLSDFLETQYGNLSSEQVEIFWQRVGMLALLDLFLGNRDRILNVDLDDNGNYSLLSSTEIHSIRGQDIASAEERSVDEENEEEPFLGTPVNLGNLMVSLARGFLLHLIDSNVGDGTKPEMWIEDLEERNLYQEFLKATLQSEEIEEKLAGHFLPALIASLKEMGEDGGDRNLIKERIAPLINALENHTQRLSILTPFKQGVREMLQQMDQVIASWDASDLKSRLNPSLIATIDERFSLLKQTPSL